MDFYVSLICFPKLNILRDWNRDFNCFMNFLKSKWTKEIEGKAKVSDFMIFFYP